MRERLSSSQYASADKNGVASFLMCERHFSSLDMTLLFTYLYVLTCIESTLAILCMAVQLIPSLPPSSSSNLISLMDCIQPGTGHSRRANTVFRVARPVITSTVTVTPLFNYYMDDQIVLDPLRAYQDSNTTGWGNVEHPSRRSSEARQHSMQGDSGAILSVSISRCQLVNSEPN